MNPKPNLYRATDSRSLKVSFPHKPVVFLDIVVRRFMRDEAVSRKGLAQLDPPPD
ncbi:MAG: hypothetical protein ACPGVU_14460 [Limisphaerales bacterium]